VAISIYASILNEVGTSFREQQSGWKASILITKLYDSVTTLYNYLTRLSTVFSNLFIKFKVI